MGFFTREEVTVPVPNAEGGMDGEHLIYIRPLTYAEEKRVQSEALKLSMLANSPEEAEVQLDTAKLQTLTLEMMIVDWEGPDFEDLPATAQNIGRLPSYVLEPVIERANEINRGPSEEKEQE